MAEKEIIKKAKKRVQEKKDFYGHLISYVSVISFLAMVNILTSPDFFWFLFPAGGWGIGLAIHYFSVFGIFDVGNKDWEDKQLEKEIKRLQKKGYTFDEEEDILDLEDEPMELKELRKERRDWNDKDFV